MISKNLFLISENRFLTSRIRISDIKIGFPDFRKYISWYQELFFHISFCFYISYSNCGYQIYIYFWYQKYFKNIIMAPHTFFCILWKICRNIPSNYQLLAFSPHKNQTTTYITIPCFIQHIYSFVIVLNSVYWWPKAIQHQNFWKKEKI